MPQGLSDAWLTTLMISLILGWLAFLITLGVAKRYRYDFKFYEGEYEKERAFRHSFVTEEQVDEKIREVAQNLDKACKEKSECSRPQNAEKLRKNLAIDLSLIEGLWKGFYFFVKTARDVGYAVSDEYQDYFIKKQMKERLKTKEVVAVSDAQDDLPL